MFNACIDDVLGAHYISCDERTRITDGIIDKSFCRSMDDNVWLFELKNNVNDMLIANIGNVESVILVDVDSVSVSFDSIQANYLVGGIFPIKN
jgi:hypothetical protein